MMRKSITVVISCLMLAACGAYVTETMWNASAQACKEQGGIKSVKGWLNADEETEFVIAYCNNGSKLHLNFSATKKSMGQD